MSRPSTGVKVDERPTELCDDRSPCPATPAALAAATACAARGRPPPERRPNVVIVLLDAVRADHLPLYGYPRDTAPFLTSLAARSVVFDRAYSSSAWTSPATASLFTSLHPFQHGVIWNIRRMRETSSA